MCAECRGCDAPNVKQLRDSLPVDFLFIDGDHSFEGLQGDWMAWKSHVALHGVVAQHVRVYRG